jgi:hypothetical protein
MIHTVPELIEAFGGIKPFAEVIEKSLPPVYRAKDLNHIPFSWRPVLYREIKARKMKVAPELLGFEAA